MKCLTAITSLVLALLAGRAALSQITVPTSNGDIGNQINSAEASMSASGGTIMVKTQGNGECYVFSVPILITKTVILEGEGPSTCLSFTGTGAAITFVGNLPPFSPQGFAPDGFGLRDITLLGSGPNSGQTGLSLGGPGNTAGFFAQGVAISNFGLGLMFNRAVWNFKIHHSYFGLNGQNVLWPSNTSYGGENMEFDSVTFVGATFKDSLHFNENIGGGYSNLSSLTFVSCNFDNAQLVIDNGSGSVRMYAPHFENPGGQSGDEPFVRILAYTAATDVVLDGPDFYNDQSNPYPPSFIELDGAPTVLISQMRSVNLDGSTNVPTNLLINGDAKVTLLGDAPLRATQQQYVVASGNPQMWVMGGQDTSNKIVTQTPMMYSQTVNNADSQSPVVQIGGNGYQPTIGFDLWTGTGSSFYGMQIEETGPGELDFCSNGTAPIGGGNYVCNAGVVNGVFKSTVPDGTAPLTVSSHTPPDNLNAWPATFTPSGAQVLNPHITTGRFGLPPNGYLTVQYQQHAQFTQPPTCTVSYLTDIADRSLRPLSSRPGLDSISIFGEPYIGVAFICVGN